MSYARFLLDGQTAILDDYLEVRPEAEAALRRLVGVGAHLGRAVDGPDGRVHGVGRDDRARPPVRPRTGRAATAARCRSATSPTSSGTSRRCRSCCGSSGIDHAVAWRGIPAAVDKTGFAWIAPDGSRRALRVPLRLVLERARHPRGRQGSAPARARLRAGARRRAAHRHVVDERHRPPDAATVARAGRRRSQRAPGRLPLRRHVVAGVPRRNNRSTGSRRSQASCARARAPTCLMGVASNRVDVHQACAAAERALERRAEPMCALLMPAAQYPHTFLDLAWRNVVLNSAHDSSCACSDDEVVDHVLVRYREARQIGDGLVRDALHALGERGRRAGGRDRRREPDCSGATWRRRGHRARRRSVPLRRARRRRARDAGDRRAPRRGLQHDGHGPEGAVGPRPDAGHRVRRAPDHVVRRSSRRPSSTTSCCRKRARASSRCDLTELKTQMLALGDDDRTMRFRLLITPHRHVLFDAGPVDGFGWSSYTVREGAGPETAVRASEHTLENEHLRVERRPRQRDVHDRRRSTAFRLPGSDVWSTAATAATRTTTPRPTIDRIVDRPDAVRIETIESGPGARPAPHRDGLHVAGVRDRRRPCLLGAFGRDRRGHGRDHARAAPRRDVPPRHP